MHQNNDSVKTINNINKLNIIISFPYIKLDIVKNKITLKLAIYCFLQVK